MRQVRSVVRFVWSHPANRNRRAGALLRAVTWQLYKRVTGRHWDVEVFGLRLRCYPDSTSAGLALYCGGYADYHEMSFLRRYLRPGDGFVDVGANVGVYTLAASSIVGPLGIVDAIEPDRKAVGRLRENVALNGLAQVRVHVTAVGTHGGCVRFSTGRDTMNRIEAPGDGVASTVEVECARLDDLLAGRCYAMGKMDIEGAEPLALQGAEAMLAAGNPPVWLLEMNGMLHGFGFDEEGVATWLRERGFDLATYDADTHELTFGGTPWHGRANVLAVCRARRDEVQTRLSPRNADPR